MGLRSKYVHRHVSRHGASGVVSLLASAHACCSLRSLRRLWWRWLLAGLSGRDLFTLIYQQNLWGVEESRSGAGSTMVETESVRSSLPPLLGQLGVASMLDLPCGDFHWMSRIDLGGVDYLGADIVPEIVQTNRERYARPGVDFVQLDIVSDDLPASDLILCRDCLVHFPDQMVFAAIANIYRSGASWLATTTFPDRQSNGDIVLGLWRPINLQAAPFSLPPPRYLLAEGNPQPEYAGKSLAVWSRDDLRAMVERTGR